MVLINLNANKNRNSAVFVNGIEPIEKRLSSSITSDHSIEMCVGMPVATNGLSLVNGGHSSASSSGDHGVGDDDDDNSKDNYDMDDGEEEEEEIINGHHHVNGHHPNDDDDASDDDRIKETDSLVEKNRLNDLEDCDYYSDGDGDDDEREEILKCNNGGDGIIANHFVGLYKQFYFFYLLSICSYVDVCSTTINRGFLGFFIVSF